MKRVTLLLLIIFILTPIVTFAEPKWIQFAITEGNGTPGKKPMPIYFDVNSIKTSDLGEVLKLVTVRMKCLEFAIAQGYPPNNPSITDQSYWQKAIDSASVESIILRYPTMTYAAPRYPSMTYTTPQMIQRGPTGFQDIPAGSILEKLYLALVEKGYVVLNPQQVVAGRKVMAGRR